MRSQGSRPKGMQESTACEHTSRGKWANCPPNHLSVQRSPGDRPSEPPPFLVHPLRSWREDFESKEVVSEAPVFRQGSPFGWHLRKHCNHVGAVELDRECSRGFSGCMVEAFGYSTLDSRPFWTEGWRILTDMYCTTKLYSIR